MNFLSMFFLPLCISSPSQNSHGILKVTSCTFTENFNPQSSAYIKNKDTCSTNNPSESECNISHFY